MTSVERERKSLARKLDFLERAVLVILYAFLLQRFAQAIGQSPLNLVYLFTEGLVVMMVLFRRTTDEVSLSPRDWLLAFGGTFAPMLLVPGERIAALPLLPELFLFAGLGVSIAAKLQLRRSFGVVAANRGIKRSGVYALVRHPMYLGYFLTQAGMIVLNFSLWNIAVLAVWAGCQVARINAEERVLSRDPLYREHMQHTRFRLFPMVY